MRLTAGRHAYTIPNTGRYMEMLTTEPTVQFYSGNFLDGSLTNKDGKTIVQALRIVPGSSALSGFSQPGRFSRRHSRAGRNLSSNDHLSLFCEIRKEGKKKYYFFHYS
jgi:galactose mutarotase-like enzyme